MRNKPDIVFLAGIDWEFLKQGQQYLAESYMKLGCRVIYIEPILHRKIRFSDMRLIIGRLQKILYRNKTLQKNITESVPAHVPVIISPITMPDTNAFYRMLNDIFFLPWIASKCRKFLTGAEVYGYYWWPTSASEKLMHLLRVNKTVYSCVDNHAAMKNCPKGLVDSENRILNESDAVFVTSEYLMKKWSDRISGRIHLRPRAVDYDLYSHSDSGPTKEIREIIFYGGLSTRIDYEAINVIARSGCRVYLYGNMRVTPTPEFDENVKYMGIVSPEELPEIISRYDAIIWPYLLNDYTSGILPAKLYECFSSGKPIFSAALPSLEKFLEFGIYIYEDHMQLVEAIRRFDPVKDESEYYQKRKIEAAEHSWLKIAESELHVIAGNKC